MLTFRQKRREKFAYAKERRKEMRVPNCREDEAYNEKYLNDEDARFLKGYDWAVENALNLLNNTSTYEELEQLLDPNKAIVNLDKEEIVKNALADWLEGERDMLITSMIDNMDDTEYEAIKARVDAE